MYWSIAKISDLEINFFGISGLAEIMIYNSTKRIFVKQGNNDVVTLVTYLDNDIWFK